MNTVYIFIKPYETAYLDIYPSVEYKRSSTFSTQSPVKGN